MADSSAGKESPSGTSVGAASKGAPSAENPSSSSLTADAGSQRYARVHVVTRTVSEESGEVEDFSSVLSRFPTLRSHARNGDLLENATVAGYRSEGWSMLVVVPPPSTEDSAGPAVVLEEEELDVDHGDDYGMPSLRFPALVEFPLDYWDVEKMECVKHYEGGIPQPKVGDKFDGYWHSDEPIVLVDVQAFGLTTAESYADGSASDVVRDIGNGYDLLVREVDGSVAATLLVKREEMRQYLADSEGREGPFLICEPLSEELRVSLCPDVSKGWAGQLYDFHMKPEDFEHLRKRPRVA